VDQLSAAILPAARGEPVFFLSVANRHLAAGFFFFEKWGVPGLCINRCTQPILLLAKLQQTIIVIHIK
jgi:hypothetical protein